MVFSDVAPASPCRNGQSTKLPRNPQSLALPAGMIAARLAWRVEETCLKTSAGIARGAARRLGVAVQ